MNRKLHVWWLGLALAVLPAVASAEKIEPLRVCADPGNMPLSNNKGEGFQNKIAELIARSLGTHATYFYRPYLNRGLTRQTFDNNECDILMDMSADDKRLMTTMPVYRSTFVLAYRNDRGFEIQSLDDPRLLNDMKVGVFQHSAIRTVLQERGIRRENTVVKTIAHDADLRPERQPHVQVQDVIDGKLDAAAIWGPMAGWYVSMKNAPLTILPLNTLEDSMPLEFELGIGLKKGAHELKQRIEKVMLENRDAIRKILEDYGVPLVQCDHCVVSGSLPSHGPYQPHTRRSSESIKPKLTPPEEIPALVEAALNAGSSPDQELINATIQGDTNRIEYLLQHGANINGKDVEGMTALMYAVKSSDLNLINGLLEYGADPNLQDNDGWTAAMHAVRQNDGKVMRLLARFRANFDLLNLQGFSALGMAVRDNRVNAAVAMLDSGANPSVVMGDSGYTPLIIAAKAGNKVLAQTLLQYGAKPNEQNAGGFTALMLAAARNDVDMIHLLLKAGADTRRKSVAGKTASMIADEENAREALDVLASYGSGNS
ncbi:MAG TPA: quinoprotein dehydrogenase-associated putative ABC transporter substrate-binding protein [Methylophilaceae bacterium]|jgi:quinoprotein dehydrogenase-associated probable ABC transporter substrate-binding protein